MCRLPAGRAVDQLMRALLRLLREVLARARDVADAPDSAAMLEPVRMCDTVVHLRIRRGAAAGLHYVNVHENEQSSVEAARAVQREFPGTMVELKGRGRRIVCFRRGLRPYAFDPNRIFTDAGAEQTLRAYASFDPAALAAVRRLREAILQLLAGPPDAPIVALHNNRAGRYSIREYEPGGLHARNAQAVEVRDDTAPEDFFVVTRREHFVKLAGQGFNVALQAEQPFDDGSLSVWCQQQRRAYVNVEALHGRADVQRRMLLAVGAVVHAEHAVRGRN